MKAYRGIFKIECSRGAKPCPNKLADNMRPGCIDCDMGEMTVLNLKGDGIHKKKKKAIVKSKK